MAQPVQRYLDRILDEHRQCQDGVLASDMPATSGVGGGIVAVLPGQLGIGV